MAANPIPPRVWWWPPVRDNLYPLRFARSALIAMKIRDSLGRDIPTHVLTVLWADYALSAAMLARKLKRPLVTIIHDQQEFWAPSPLVQKHHARRNRIVVSQSDLVFGVSKEIMDAYHVKHDKGSVLYPMPGDQRYDYMSMFEPGKPLRVFFAGSLHPWQSANLLALASRLSIRGGRLVLVTDVSNVVYQRLSEHFPETERIEPPKDNEEVVRAIAENATACLVSYSLSPSAQPWGASSFPSKFIDFSRAGVPILIIAPENSAIGLWCKRTGYDLFAQDISDESLDFVIDRLQDANGWRASASRVRDLAVGEFSAQTIHRTFEEMLSLRGVEAAAHDRKEQVCRSF